MPEENYSPPSSPQRPSTLKSFLNHLVVMPKLHKKLLAGALLLAGGGSLGQISSYVSKGAETSQNAPATIPANVPGNSMVAQGSTEAPAPAAPSDPTITERVSPVAQKLGFGFIAGFMIGWVFRAFVKIMSLVTMMGVAIFAGLAYLDVDMSAIKTKFESGMGWATKQGEELADKAMKRLPGSAAGVTGMFFGFKRKK